MARALTDFDMHTIVRLIQRERIPGFKMLPQEARYLEEYREALREQYQQTKEEHGDKDEHNEKASNGEAKDEVEPETKKTRRSRKKSTTVLEEIPEAEVVEEKEEEVAEPVSEPEEVAEVVDYSKMTVAELKEVAASKNISVAGMKKAEIIEALTK